MWTIKLWTHTSIWWWIFNAFHRSASIGWNVFQVFAKSPRWRNFIYDKLSKSEIERSRDWWSLYWQKWGIIHSVYLVNLAKPFDLAYHDIDSVIDDFKVAKIIWFGWVNVHLWKYGELPKDQAIENMCKNIWYILEQIKDYDVKFVLENTAWQGSEIGWNFKELWWFYDDLKKHLNKDLVEEKVYFCFDTAHARWAGYDIGDWDSVLTEFEKYIWLDKLYCFHLNDAKVPIWSRLDRHANIWCGFIWLHALNKVIKRAVENDRPLVLETPDEERWSQEITFIKKILSGEYDDKRIQDFHKKNFKTEFLKKFEDIAIWNSLFG